MNSLITRNILAGAIILGVAAPGFAWANKASSASSQEITKVQEALKAKGEDPGPIDGIMGMKTRAAIKAFQSANGLKSTGTLDKQTEEKLGVEESVTSSNK